MSGYLLFWKQLSSPRINENRRIYILTGSKTLILNILYRIIIPSVIFSVIEFVPSCIIQGRNMEVGYALYKTIGGGTYWFTSALVVAELILLLLLITRRKNIWFYTIVCAVLGLFGILIVKYELSQNGVWAWRQGLVALIFLAMGGLYWRYEKQIDHLMKWWVALPLLCVYLLLVLFYDNANPLISTLQIQPLGFVTSAIACLLLVWLCKCLPVYKPLSFIGQNSMGFYFMSGALPITVSMLAHKGIADINLMHLIFVWVICLVLAYVIVAIINRWLPWLWDLRGFRKHNS